MYFRKMVAVTLPNLIDFDQAKQVLVWPPTHPCNAWVNFYWSTHCETTVIYLCIHSFYIFPFIWLYKDTTTCNSFEFSYFLRIANIKNVPLINFSPKWSSYSIRKTGKKRRLGGIWLSLKGWQEHYNIFWEFQWFYMDL